MAIKKSWKNLFVLVMTLPAMVPMQVLSMDADQAPSNTRLQGSENFDIVTDFEFRPVKTITEALVQGVKYGAPTALVLGSYYDLLWQDILPNWISLPVTTLATLIGYGLVKDNPTVQSVTGDINEGLQNEGINLDGITSTAKITLSSMISPKETVTSIYETTKNAGKELLRDTFNIEKEEEVNPAIVTAKLAESAKESAKKIIKGALEIPEQEEVTIPVVANKIADGIKDKVQENIRNALEIPEDQNITIPVVANRVLNGMKDELEDELRRGLEIPPHQAVNLPRIIHRIRDMYQDEFELLLQRLREDVGHEAATAWRNLLDIPADQAVSMPLILNRLREMNQDQVNRLIADFTPIVRDINNAAFRNLWAYGSSAAGLAAAAPLAIIAAWFSGKYIMHKLKNPEPKVFRSTSQKSYFQRFIDFVLRREQIIPEMIYAKDLEERLTNITKATIAVNQKIREGKTNVFYRNLLLEGPPGTGKTYYARNMIRQVNKATNGRIQWRETNGSALLKGGIKAIDEMFEWLEKQDGACVFIDEADTLFCDRDKLNLNDEQVIVLNHLLNYLGDRSNKYMFILATNRKIVFDAAMERRIDDLVTVPLPEENERIRVLQMYRNTLLLAARDNSVEFITSVQQCLTDQKIFEIAQKTTGLSNGDLQGIISTIKSEADITTSGLITTQIIDMVVRRYIEKHQALSKRNDRDPRP